MEEAIQKVINDNPDSIEIGTPGKGGAVKVYGDFKDLELFKTKLTNARDLKVYAQNELGL